MSNSRDRRIIKELQDLTEDKDNSGIHAAPVQESSLTTLKGWFLGPGNTPYEGGKYVIKIVLDNQYPFKPPRMQFETKIWHPNVSSQTVRPPLIPGFLASSTQTQTPPPLSLWRVVWGIVQSDDVMFDHKIFYFICLLFLFSLLLIFAPRAQFVSIFSKPTGHLSRL